MTRHITTPGNAPMDDDRDEWPDRKIWQLAALVIIPLLVVIIAVAVAMR